MAAHAAETRDHVGRLAEFVAQQGRREEVVQQVPGRAHGLVGVPGPAAGDALAPAQQAIALHRDQNGLAAQLAAKAGLEGMNVGKGDVMEVDVGDEHSNP
jgi:hypothetical protein